MLLPQFTEKGRLGKVDMIQFGLLMKITKPMMDIGDPEHVEDQAEGAV